MEKEMINRLLKCNANLHFIVNKENKENLIKELNSSLIKFDIIDKDDYNKETKIREFYPKLGESMSSDKICILLTNKADVEYIDFAILNKFISINYN